MSEKLEQLYKDLAEVRAAKEKVNQLEAEIGKKINNTFLVKYIWIPLRGGYAQPFSDLGFVRRMKVTHFGEKYCFDGAGEMYLSSQCYDTPEEVIFAMKKKTAGEILDSQKRLDEANAKYNHLVAIQKAHEKGEANFDV